MKHTLSLLVALISVGHGLTAGPGAAEVPTFAKDVAPILFDN